MGFEDFLGDFVACAEIFVGFTGMVYPGGIVVHYVAAVLVCLAGLDVEDSAVVWPADSELAEGEVVVEWWEGFEVLESIC